MEAAGVEVTDKAGQAAVAAAAGRVLISALFTAPAVPSPGPAAVLTPSVAARLRSEWWPTAVPVSRTSPVHGFGPPILPMALDCPVNIDPLGRVTRAAAHALQWSHRRFWVVWSPA